MNKENERELALNKIHELATSDDHRQVQYGVGGVGACQKAVIAKLEKKLAEIADLVQVACGD